jgi:cyclopropane fatty-acyl-phospholipid synthase-like methyltransferase
MRLTDLLATARARAAALLAPLLAALLRPLVALLEALTYRDLLPDCALRAVIRALLRARLASMPRSLAARTRAKAAFVEGLRRMPVAVQQADANEQHYELPTPYFQLALGEHLKYSCCLYGGGGGGGGGGGDEAAPTGAGGAPAAASGADCPGPVAGARAYRQLARAPASRAAEELARAERAMLALTCARAGLADGQRILELGCGWGSLTLFMAAAFPGASVVAVSNSRTQRQHIERAARERGLGNVAVVTADMVAFEPPHGDGAYDRVVSVEMLEHMKNYEVVFARVARWLGPGGRFFAHVFAHRDFPYHFEARDETDWMARHFFSGGTMPSLDLFLRFQEPAGLRAADIWWVDGRHYSRTLEAWLARHDRARRAVLAIFEQTYGAREALRWFVMWRLFYLACSELFAYAGGDEWGVAHYLFEKPAAAEEGGGGGGDGDGGEEGSGGPAGARGRLAAGLRAAAARVMG